MRIGKITVVLLFYLVLSGCSALGELALGALYPSSSGTEVTAQVGAENQKGLANASIDSGDEKSTEVGIGDVNGSVQLDASQIVNSTVNLPAYVVLLIALGFWCIRTPFGMFWDFLRARRKYISREGKE